VVADRLVVQGGRWNAAGAAVVPRRRRSQLRRNRRGTFELRLRMYLEPKEEFKQIFNEGWRNQRDYLYVPNMHGADWPKMKQMYGQLLPYVMHRADLNYLMDMMGAEIAIGHSYVRGGDMPSVPQQVGGLLGADFVIENGRYKVTRIYDNESWNPICVRHSPRRERT
jgi:tricorn protease